MKKIKRTLLSIITAASVIPSATSLCANAVYKETNKPVDHSDYIKIDYLSNETTDFYIRKGENKAETYYNHRILVETKLNDRIYFSTPDESDAIPKVTVPDEISALFKEFTTDGGDAVKVYVTNIPSEYEYYVAPYNSEKNGKTLKFTSNDARRIKELLNNIVDEMSYTNSVYSPSNGYTYLTNLTFPESFYTEKYEGKPAEDRARIYAEAKAEAAGLLNNYLADKDYDVTLNTDNDISLTPNKEISLEEHLALLEELYNNCHVQIQCMIEASASEKYSGIDLFNAVDGDANCDEDMNMADAVLIMQSLANPDKYQISEQGEFNSDLNGDGITNADALAIQKKLLKLD